MTDIGGPLFLLAVLSLIGGMLIVAAVIEGIAKATADHDCAGYWCGCRGRDEAPRGR